MTTNWMRLLIGAVLTLPILALMWKVAVRKISLRQFGMNLVVDTLQWQPDNVQQAIYSRGTLTRLQWYMLRRSAIKRCRKELA